MYTGERERERERERREREGRRDRNIRTSPALLSKLFSHLLCIHYKNNTMTSRQGPGNLIAEIDVTLRSNNTLKQVAFIPSPVCRLPSTKAPVPITEPGRKRVDVGGGGHVWLNQFYYDLPHTRIQLVENESLGPQRRLWREQQGNQHTAFSQTTKHSCRANAVCRD